VVQQAGEMECLAAIQGWLLGEQGGAGGGRSAAAAMSGQALTKVVGDGSGFSRADIVCHKAPLYKARADQRFWGRLAR
jgi:hypothetical protein